MTGEESKYDLDRLIQDFLVTRQVEGNSPATLSFYRENLRRFRWWLRESQINPDLRKLNTMTLRAFLFYVQTTPKRWAVGSKSSEHIPSIVTVDAYWRTLQAFFSWLVREEIIDVNMNPIRKLPRAKLPIKVVQDIPLKLIQQAIDLWDKETVVGARNQAVILVLLDTGIRLSECANLKLSDVNLEYSLLKVIGKGNKERIVRLGNNSSKAVSHYLLKRKDYANESLWICRNGKPFTRDGIQIMIRRLRKLGGNVRWSPHTFRNTFAINFLRAGGDPFTLQILGGWEDLDMPRHYCAALRVEDAFAVHQKASPGDRLSISIDL